VVLTIVLHKVIPIRQSVLEPLSKDAPPTGTWLAQSVKHVTLDLGVVSLSPTLGVEFTLKKKKMPPSAQKTRIPKDLGLSPAIY